MITQVPVDGDGHVISYPQVEHRRSADGLKWVRVGPEYVDLPPFEGKLRLVDYERGQSAARFTLEDEAGRRYPVFFKDMFDMLVGQEFEGTWAPRKSGSNYAIRRVSK